MSIIANRAEGANELTNMIVGHTLSLDPGTQDIVIEPDREYKDRYFIPDVPLSNVYVDESGKEVGQGGQGQEEMYLGIGASNMGVYANDLAYVPSADAGDEPVKLTALQVSLLMYLKEVG